MTAKKEMSWEEIREKNPQFKFGLTVPVISLGRALVHCKTTALTLQYTSNEINVYNIINLYSRGYTLC